MQKSFKIELRVTTECEESVDEADVLEWVTEQFVGCDLGSVKVVRVVQTSGPSSSMDVRSDFDHCGEGPL